MTQLQDYESSFKTIQIERKQGILQLTFHSRGGSLEWGALPHREWGECFRAVADDPENRVVILCGTGETFCGPPGSREDAPIVSPAEWERIRWNGYRLVMALLEVEAPIITVLNGPVWRHADAALLGDIVLAAENCIIQDSAHFINGIVPGDGMHVIMPLLLGLNRARYFLLTGQELKASDALELGLVHEVLPRSQLVSRAWELAEDLNRQPQLALRYTRILITEQLRRLMHEMLGYGLALEGLAAVRDWVENQTRLSGK
jgi:enoyl-CoA hydratase/carnithine racemase